MKDKSFNKLIKRPFNIILIFIMAILFQLNTPNSCYAKYTKNNVLYVNPTEAHQLLKENNDIVILDIQPNREYKKNHIEGALHHSYFSFKFKKWLKKMDPDKTYLVYCVVGESSQWALKTMKKAGLKNIIHMDHGIKEWKELGLPIKTNK